MDEDVLMCGWTIYQAEPYYEVLMWWITDSGQVVPRSVAVVCHTLDEARAEVGAGTMCFPREETDHPSVVETYL